jgi:transposase
MQDNRSRVARASAPAGSRTEPKSELTDEQWFLIESFFPEETVSPAGGRPRVPARQCLAGVIWVLRSGARWKDLPEGFPSPATCWRRLQEWTQMGLWVKIWSTLGRQLDKKGRVEHDEAIGDGTFSSAKKGVSALEKPNEARAPRSCSWSTEMVCLSR